MRFGGIFLLHLVRLAKRLGLNLLFFAALWTVGLALGVVLPWFLAMFGAVIAWLALSAYALGRYEDHFDGWAILVSTIPVMMTSMAGGEYVHLSLATPQEIRSLSQAAGSSTGRVLKLPEWVGIRKDLAYRHVTIARSKSGGTTRSTYHVAPLVGPDWQPSDPIHAWVTCSPGFPMGCKQFPSRAPLGITPPGFQSSGFETAVKQACAKQSLNCPKAHLLMEAVPSISAAVADEKNAVFLSPVIGFFAWAVPRVLLDLYRLAAALLGALFRRPDDQTPTPAKR